jgi:hypothetical protein
VIYMIDITKENIEESISILSKVLILFPDNVLDNKFVQNSEIPLLILLNKIVK